MRKRRGFYGYPRGGGGKNCHQSSPKKKRRDTEEKKLGKGEKKKEEGTYCENSLDRKRRKRKKRGPFRRGQASVIGHEEERGICRGRGKEGKNFAGKTNRSGYTIRETVAKEKDNRRGNQSKKKKKRKGGGRGVTL